jgi:hypothetical protein
MSRCIAALLVVLAACASAEPDPSGRTFDPELEKSLATSDQQKAAADSARKDFNSVLVQLDHAMESYVRAVSNSGVPRYDVERERLDRLLRQLVSGDPPGTNTQKLIALAGDGTDPWFQGIALAALGFADRSDVMPVILQGAQLGDPQLVDRAVLGLAILGDARTPPGVISKVALDENHHDEGRVGAAWALVVLQEKSNHVDQIIPVWLQILDGGPAEHPLLVANAVRGLGLTRDTKYADRVTKCLEHPSPRVRINAAIALARMNAQREYEKLLSLLGPGETSANVRLAARKALQTLAGGVDHGYQIELWRREFERGR